MPRAWRPRSAARTPSSSGSRPRFAYYNSGSKSCRFAPRDDISGTVRSWSERTTLMRVLILGNEQKPSVPAVAGRVRDAIRDHGGEVVGFDLRQETQLTGRNADLAIVLGGDGAILRAARQM